MKFDAKQLFDYLDQGLAMAEASAPLLQAFGIPAVGPIAIVSGVSEVMRNVQQRISEGQVVLEEQDQAKLQEYLGKIQAINDALAARIAQT